MIATLVMIASTASFAIFFVGEELTSGGRRTKECPSSNNSTGIDESKSTADDNASALCIELVGNRFLRRMVRLLVESTVRIALTAEAQNKDSLLQQVLKKDRRIIGNNAPADGLFFVGARFSAM